MTKSEIQTYLEERHPKMKLFERESPNWGRHFLLRLRERQVRFKIVAGQIPFDSQVSHAAADQWMLEEVCEQLSRNPLA